MSKQEFQTGQYVIVEGKCEGVKHDGRLLINFFGENPELTAVYPKNVLPKPQKVVIPKFVAEWIEDNKSDIDTLYTAYALLSRIKNDVSLWVNSNQDTFARAWLDGYEVEKEKMYIIPLKSLITTDGHQQYLTGKAGRFFASRRNYSLKQTFTQTELDNNVPACYREWAEPVEVE
ncbi:DUF1642 domain-containing protein [Streptococcus sp. S784/96/1]|uniref:DUF1642 domain-containing protein n=1 Tax=Streptococcus sp. S784/96/1 TaxID=2653499 RepID=UPI0013870E6D|nr:DUF1642 domain-containing protein [Streptococcus sp. S784/96/1]